MVLIWSDSELSVYTFENFLFEQKVSWLAWTRDGFQLLNLIVDMVFKCFELIGIGSIVPACVDGEIRFSCCLLSLSIFE
jgi:hypothetical protein